MGLKCYMDWLLRYVLDLVAERFRIKREGKSHHGISSCCLITVHKAHNHEENSSQPHSSTIYFHKPPITSLIWLHGRKNDFHYIGRTPSCCAILKLQLRSYSNSPPPLSLTLLTVGWSSRGGFHRVVTMAVKEATTILEKTLTLSWWLHLIKVFTLYALLLTTDPFPSHI